MATTHYIVKIDTASGFDTEYLFPGLFPHIVDGVSHNDETGVGFLRYWLTSDGQTISTHHFQLDIADGANFITDSTTDLGGGIFGWSIQDLNDASHAKLAEIQILDGTGVSLQSMSSVTPDALRSQYASHGAPCEITFLGNAGNDTLRGTDWADTLNGGLGSDLMIGGGGNDVYYVDNKGDRIVDSSGADDYVVTTINYTLGSALETLLGTGTIGLHLTGNSKANTVQGAAGSDLLKGLGGADSLIGFGGRDTMTGGDGKDTFFFWDIPNTTKGQDTHDTVTDFKANYDHINLLGYSFGFFPTNPSIPLPTILSPDAFYASNSGKAHDASDRIIYDKDDGILYLDRDGNGAGARVEIAKFDHHPTLHYSDFTVMWV